MGKPYRIKIANHNIYREFEISEEITHVCLGTTPVCEFRLDQEDYFCPIEISFELNLNCKTRCNPSRSGLRP